MRSNCPRPNPSSTARTSNCETSSRNEYPVARSRVYKDPAIERCTTRPFDTDSWEQKESMRDKRGSVVESRDIFQNPSRDIRDYPINIFIDSTRREDSVGSMQFRNGIINFAVYPDAKTGVSTMEDIRHITRMKINEIRIPNNNDPIVNLNFYNKFTLLVDPIGGYHNVPLPGPANASNANYHFEFTPTFNGAPPDPDATITLDPMYNDVNVPAQGITEYMQFTFRSPFTNYNFPPDYFDNAILIAGTNPAQITVVGHTLTKAYTVIFLNPTTPNTTVNAALANPAGLVITIVDENNFTVPVDASTIAVNVPNLYIIIPVNRVIFSMELTTLRY